MLSVLHCKSEKFEGRSRSEIYKLAEWQNNVRKASWAAADPLEDSSVDGSS